MKLNRDYVVRTVAGLSVGGLVWGKSWGEHIAAGLGGFVVCFFVFIGTIVLGAVLDHTVSLFSRDYELEVPYDAFNTSLLTSAVWALGYIFMHIK